MVQPIGSQQTYRDVLRTAAQNAFNSYANPDPAEYNEQMRVFYTEGKKNPTVAKMILHDAIRGIVANKYNEMNNALSSEVNEINRTSAHGIHKRSAIKDAKSIVTNAKVRLWNTTVQAHTTEMGDRLQEDVAQLRDGFNAEFNELYPRTGRIRECLIRDFGVNDTNPAVSKRGNAQKGEIIRTLKEGTWMRGITQKPNLFAKLFSRVKK